MGTFERLVQLHYVRVVQCSHRVYLLHQALLQLRIIYHLLLRQTLYRVEGRR